MATWGDHQQDFNTSHVYINPLTFITYRQPAIISIHLMFILIRKASGSHGAISKISIHLMFILIERDKPFRCISPCYFNTSHVYINPGMERSKRKMKRFQYISCLY